MTVHPASPAQPSAVQQKRVSVVPRGRLPRCSPGQRHHPGHRQHPPGVAGAVLPHRGLRRHPLADQPLDGLQRHGQPGYLWYDPAWFKSVRLVGVSAIGLAASLRTLQVLPFDFSCQRGESAPVSPPPLTQPSRRGTPTTLELAVTETDRWYALPLDRSARSRRPRDDRVPHQRPRCRAGMGAPTRGQLSGRSGPVSSSGVMAARVSGIEMGGLTWLRPKARNTEYSASPRPRGGSGI